MVLLSIVLLALLGEHRGCEWEAVVGADGAIFDVFYPFTAGHGGMHLQPTIETAMRRFMYVVGDAWINHESETSGAYCLTRLGIVGIGRHDGTLLGDG